jgi:hypothetical protein
MQDPRHDCGQLAPGRKGQRIEEDLCLLSVFPLRPRLEAPIFGCGKKAVKNRSQPFSVSLWQKILSILLLS